MPERMYKIGEASQILKLKSYVLRFWETEFPQLNPARTGRGQRLYSEADLDLLKSIRRLLHERGLTIEGARKALQSGEEEPAPENRDSQDEEDFSGDLPDEVKTDSAGSERAVLRQVLEELKDISSMLRAQD
ncbi:MAG: MerR family transcriptional regulator [Deltaproteobacteria bacterium]|jgi:DNA-binding transcriptional MerR regulator|nr:MerR family transcriptional regulator [Deltaproteobacteria bacterium]